MQVKEPTFSVSNMFTFNSQQYFKYFDYWIGRNQRGQLDTGLRKTRLCTIVFISYIIALKIAADATRNDLFVNFNMIFWS